MLNNMVDGKQAVKIDESWKSEPCEDSFCMNQQ